MNNAEIKNKLDVLKEDNEKRITQVQQWNEDIQELRNVIAKAKEDHDFVRGQISALDGLLTESSES
jgi:hypothetical protein